MNTSKKNKNTLPSGIKCCIRKCKKSKRHNAGLKMFKFPAPEMSLGQIWRQKCLIPKEDYEKTFYICENHFVKSYVGRKKLKADAIPTIELDEMARESQDNERLKLTQVTYTIKELAEEPKVVNKAIMDSLEEQQQASTTQPDSCQQYMTQVWVLKLSQMSGKQRSITEKLINEVMFNGELGLLNYNTGLTNISSVNNTDSYNNNITLQVEIKQELQDL